DNASRSNGRSHRSRRPARPPALQPKRDRGRRDKSRLTDRSLRRKIALDYPSVVHLLSCQTLSPPRPVTRIEHTASWPSDASSDREASVRFDVLLQPGLSVMSLSTKSSSVFAGACALA